MRRTNWLPLILALAAVLSPILASEVDEGSVSESASKSLSFGVSRSIREPEPRPSIARGKIYLGLDLEVGDTESVVEPLNVEEFIKPEETETVPLSVLPRRYRGMGRRGTRPLRSEVRPLSLGGEVGGTRVKDGASFEFLAQPVVAGSCAIF
ncbi:MAG: hypothetical protein GY716_25470 [bacterium]|nr:hypothetical protein [bacterium]